MTTEAAWGVVVPVKDTREAKSRLGDIDGDRRQLAIAMAQDTLSAVAGAARVGRVVVVCDRAEDTELFAGEGVTTVVQKGSGLNEAILAGAAALRAAGIDHVAVLPGDLPYLHSDELDAALARAAAFPSACVGDRPGRGTTLLTARHGTELLPRYGVGSLARHREAGVVEISVPVWSGLRRDVDVRADLALVDGLSERTRQVVESRRALELAGALP